jgi:hypothetical protein
MPLIKPEVQKVLKQAGLIKTSSSQSIDRTVSETLTDSGLSDDNLAEELTYLALHSQNEGLRLRAIETALKVKGALKEVSPASIPSFTIVIQNSSKDLSKTEGLSPTVFPRQSFSKTTKEEEPN